MAANGSFIEIKVHDAALLDFLDAAVKCDNQGAFNFLDGPRKSETKKRSWSRVRLSSKHAGAPGITTSWRVNYEACFLNYSVALPRNSPFCTVKACASCLHVDVLE